jgi:hypothetical protein
MEQSLIFSLFNWSILYLFNNEVSNAELLVRLIETIIYICSIIIYALSNKYMESR